jgi:hypothetical protein
MTHNPFDAGPRIQRQIADRINDSVAMQSAAQMVDAYQSQNRISAGERVIMQKALSTGEVDNLPAAHAWARFATAADIKDSHERDVVAAARAQEGSQMFFAKLTVADFERSHPDVRRNGPVRNRMRELLAAGAAQDMETAYRMAKR